jgi:hypothetical protein
VRTAKVVESIDIAAPRAEVFQIIVNCDRRLQLSPLWGTGEIEDISPDFPQEGSHYHTKLIDDGILEEYDTIVTSHVTNQKFSYRLTSKRQPEATWTFQDVPQGTRLIYHEEFLVDEAGEDEFVQSVRKIVTEWLGNTKRYAELRGGWWQPYARRAVDKYLLPLRVDQRRVIFLLLAWQLISCLALLALGAGWGTARLLGIM